MDYEKAYKELLSEHKETLAKLASESEGKSIFHQVLISSARSLAVINLDLKIEWTNDRAREIFGYTLEEIKGKRISEVLFREDTDISMVPQSVEKVLNGISSSYEQQVYRKDGTKVWLRVELRPIYNEQKEVYKITVYGLDITQERELKRIAAEGERRHKTLLDQMNEIAYTIELDGNINYINKAWTKILGYSKEETLGKNGRLFFHPDDVMRSQDARKEVIEKGLPSYNLDLRAIAKSGKTVWINTTTVPVFNTAGEIVGFSGMAKDITKQKREQQIQELLSKHTRMMLSLHDKDTNYEYISPSVQVLTGWSPSELIGTPSFNYYHPEDIPRIQEYRKANMRGEISYENNLEIRYRKKDGTYIWIELSPRWFYDFYTDSYKTIISAILVDKKKWEEQKLLAELEEAKKLNLLKTNFLQFVSHEFKTPLSIIKALCELIDMSIEDNAVDAVQLKEDIVSIDNEVGGLVELIDDVLILEELESGKVNLRFKGLDIKSIITNVNERLSHKYKDREKAIINLVGKPQHVPGDSKYLELIFRNLLSNAYKYSEGKAAPIVTIHFFDNQCVVSVKDFGIGVPEEDLKNLFDNFFRAGNVGNIEGTGLGLSLVKRFVEMHGGNIVCVSKVNEGTEMYVSLRVEPEAQYK